METKIEVAKEVQRIQGENGNWNFDEYMLGLYNGMEMILSVLEDREPEFRSPPKAWIVDVPVTAENVEPKPCLKVIKGGKKEE